MAATIKDLGKVTAYAYAKAAGYTGTEEQFQAIFNEFTEEAPGLMDRLDAAVARAEAAVTEIDATVQDAVDDAVEEATASAVATANQAVTDAQAAQTAAEGAVTQANNAVTQANAAVTAAQSAQSAAEDAAASFVLDRTLTDSGAAAPADLVGDLKESVGDVVGVVSDSVSIGMSSDLVIRGLINTSNRWSTSSGFYSYALSVNAGQYHSITVTAGENEARIGILARSTLVNQQTPTYATGYNETVIIPSGETRTIAVPSDCVYIVISKETSDRDLTPASVILNGWKTIPAIDDTLTVLGDAADAKATGDEIRVIKNAITITESVDISSATVIRGLINTSNKWSTSSGFYSYGLSVNAGQYHSITVTAGENEARIGILARSTLVNQQTPTYATGYNETVIIPSGETRTIAVPSDCVYIVISKETSDRDLTPNSIVLVKWGIGAQKQIPLGLHEMPISESALNIVKRCRQMTDIKWTPGVDLPRYMLVQRADDVMPDIEDQNYLGTFKAGTEYTGIPYGRVIDTMRDYGYDYATAGHYIDFETFVSSVFNPQSKLCTENVGNVSAHKSVIYATVCSGLTCYALNVPEVATANIANISGLSLVGKVNDNGILLADGMFRIGDILNMSNFHTAIITDIIRDNDGTIQYVELSEATPYGLADRNYADWQIGGICRRKGWTREDLFDTGLWGDYSLYRYTKSIPYTPSRYVKVGDEFNMQRIEHFPCMPYEGNKFTYKTGYIPNNAVKILVSLSGYDYLKVFKDGTEISGSPFTVTNETASIDVSEISSGVYTAYLCNITDGNVVNLTYPCEWTIEN